MLHPCWMQHWYLLGTCLMEQKGIVHVSSQGHLSSESIWEAHSWYVSVQIEYMASISLQKCGIWWILRFSKRKWKNFPKMCVLRVLRQYNSSVWQLLILLVTLRLVLVLVLLYRKQRFQIRLPAICFYVSIYCLHFTFHLNLLLCFSSVNLLYL